MIHPGTDDITKGWTFGAERGWPPDLVQRFCVQDPAWQKVRLSMKGIPTHEKLKILWSWYVGRTPENDGRRRCQVDNYLGALRRGGQLDDNNMIRKYI